MLQFNAIDTKTKYLAQALQYISGNETGKRLGGVVIVFERTFVVFLSYHGQDPAF